MPRVALLASMALTAMLTPALCWSQPPTPAATLSPADASAITAALAAAPSQGLPAMSVPSGPGPGQGGDTPAADPLAQAAIAYARAEHGLITNPRTVDQHFALRPADDAAAQFAAARTAGQIPAWIAALAHTDPTYLALVKARTGYAALDAAGGWPTLPDGPALKLGASDARVAALRQRLLIEGYAAAAATPDLTALANFDPVLKAALVSFQAHHALKADGVLSKQTVAALNVPAAARLAAIDVNLERARWLPSQLPADRIEVDIAVPEASLFEAGEPALTMRAIVGRADRQTPTFASKVVGIVFNPPWVVPTGIAAREILPKARKSPGYLARNGFDVVNGQVIQRPGPKAALGYLKFQIPDPFDVYLHDTPGRSLFARDKRWLSHGCVRLEKPRDLAAALLRSQGYDRAAVDAAIATGETKTVAVKRQIPVFIIYRTVVVDDAGQASFRTDVYDWDAEIAAALARLHA